jgi:hypothetical protein
MTHTNGLPTHAELSSLPREVIIANIDQVLRGTINEWRLMYAQLLRDELARRERAESDAKMLEFTRQVRTMTVIITFATIVGVILTGAMFYLQQKN